ncbi:MAG TPA: 30S ribosomal protein S12 methylthiotransferase RimO [Melioribacteraceae bacterium]|nr:30S ribosomal protein S12 methylthiotransferase RimO [Melioribacteraceae bacterium]
MKKVAVVTLGCSKNTVDSERLINQLKLNNMDLVENADEADYLIINTCGFIKDAKEESIDAILEGVELKKEGKLKKIIAAGCLPVRYKSELQKEIPEVDAFFGSEEYEKILNELKLDLKSELLGERELLTPKHYAYLKISEGCDNPCSFCAIPLMRGKHISRSMESLIEETEMLAKKGVKELLIIGQDTTYYGKDIYGKRNIAELINKLSKVEGIEWIKLLYAYPSNFPDDLIEEIANNPKVCKYLDIPLQHINDEVLKSMRRGISKRRTIELLELLRNKIPDITIRTTFIVGYPNETEERFDELVSFIEEFKFDRLGVFDYSVEDDTVAFPLGDKISQEEKDYRKNKIMEIQEQISYEKNQNLIGKTLKVIIDNEEEDYYIARSSKDVPEVDCEVLIKKEGSLIIGEFYTVNVIDCDEFDLFAKIS